MTDKGFASISQEGWEAKPISVTALCSSLLIFVLWAVLFHILLVTRTAPPPPEGVGNIGFRRENETRQSHFCETSAGFSQRFKRTLLFMSRGRRQIKFLFCSWKICLCREMEFLDINLTKDSSLLLDITVFLVADF
jgi:hypothetical protein